METIEGVINSRNNHLYNHYQSITFMPFYSDFSFEELRAQDYIIGLKTGDSVPTKLSTPIDHRSGDRQLNNPVSSKEADSHFAETGTIFPEFVEQVGQNLADSVILRFQSISFMPTYAKYSPEELRVQDYHLGRKIPIQTERRESDSSLCDLFSRLL
ncbi:hypothetical protein CPB86DRAFT_785134 [Serendipita vermifera]|nr:hypothetical protein CPB86DRAFT_785134 [Serendipita vermifera]